MNYEKFMLQAITNANSFKYTAKPNPVVGAILLKDKKIISEGYHERFGENHAEINALEVAKKQIGKTFKDFSELTLICTLEPCSHQGKTGSCAKEIVKTGIKNIVIGSEDPNPKVAGKGIEILKKNKLKVTTGILENLVEKQNKFFFFKHKNNKPYITLKIARSVDGKSHYKNNERTFITNKSSRTDVQTIRACHDAILTGGNTLKYDNPRMNARVNFPCNQPRKILLTSKSYDEKLHFFKDAHVDVFHTKNLQKIISSYIPSDICSILVEAGPKLANAFLKANYVDELIIFTSKKKLGENGINWFSEVNAVENYGFKLESSYKIDTDLKEIFTK